MATTDREDAILIKADGLKLPGKPHNQPMKQRIMDAAQRIIDRNPATPEPPTLVSLTISPATVNVPVNTQQQFTAHAAWSDGTTALPALLWTTTGGAIDTTGLWLGTGTAGSYQVGCAGGGKTATAIVTVSAVTPPPDGQYPNEPAGFTAITEYDYSTLSPGASIGTWYNINTSWCDATVASDANAPKSPSGIVRFTYPAGTGAGPFPEFVKTFPVRSEIYACTWFKISNPWDQHSSGVSKMLFIGNTFASPDNEVVFAYIGGEVRGICQNPVQYNNAYMPCNIASGAWSLGHWHKLEIHLIRNTSGAADGVMKWWIDGVLVGHHAPGIGLGGMTYNTAGAGGFNAWKTLPYWGGDPAADSKAQTDTVDWDHTYVSGKSTDDPVPPEPGNGVTYFDEDWSSGDKSRNQGGFRWGIANAGSGDVLPTVTTVNPYPGKTHSLQFQYAGNSSLSDDSNSEQRFIFGQNVKEVYCRAYLYFPDGTEGLGSARFEHRYPGSAENNNKLFLLWDVEYGNYHVAHTVQYRTTESIAPDSTYDPNIGVKYADGKQSGVGQHGVMAGGYIGGSIVIDDAIRGRWSKWQWHVKVGTTSSSSNNLYAATGDGVSELWIDDVLRFSRKNLPLYSHYPNANNWFQNGYILGWANSGFAQTTRVWVGPITFAPAFITD